MRLVRGWLLSLMALLCAQGIARAQDGEVALPPGTERVLYVPLPDTTSPRVKRQESAVIARAFRTEKLAEHVSLLPIQDPLVFSSLEPGFAIEARRARCADVDPTRHAAATAEARLALEEGRLPDAVRLTDEARNLLACVETPMGRRELAELFLYTGLALVGSDTVESEVWLRSALGVDDTVKDSLLIPDLLRGDLERIAYEVESGAKVDARLSPEEGELWQARNFRVDGRPMLFDKYFLELVPGWHYFQVNLPDKSTWGALVRVDKGEVANVVELVRSTMGLRELFKTQMAAAMDVGRLESALSQGLRLYAEKLGRQQIYLAALAVTTDNSGQLTLRRYHVDRGLEVPSELAIQGSPETPFLPVQFVPPWGFDASFGFSQMGGQSLGYSSSALGLDVGGRYILGNRFYGGASLLAGSRFSDVGLVEEYNPPGKPDVAATAFVGGELALGALTLRADAGLIRHVTHIYDLPFQCRLYVPDEATTDVTYGCADQANLEELNGSPDLEQSGDPYRFLLEGRAAGPRLRGSLVFSPFRTQGVELQGMLRAAWSPLTVTIVPGEDLVVYDQATGEVSPGTVSYYLLGDSARQSFQRLDIGFGLSGTF